MASEFRENCRLIVGLGNTGTEFCGTRHNIGFELIDLLSNEHGITMNKSKFKSIYGCGTIAGQSVVLVKPTSGMNLSGSPVKEWLNFLGLDRTSMLIIHDAADLSFGSMKVKVGGSSGQNGVKDIVKKLGSTTFPRLKLGIGRPEKNGTDLVNWVLGRFRSTDAPLINEMLSTAQKCLLAFAELGIDKAMDDFNGEKAENRSPKKKSSSSSVSSTTPCDCPKMSEQISLVLDPIPSTAVALNG